MDNKKNSNRMRNNSCFIVSTMGIISFQPPIGRKIKRSIDSNMVFITRSQIKSVTHIQHEDSDTCYTVGWIFLHFLYRKMPGEC